MPSILSIDESSDRGFVHVRLHGEIDLGGVTTIRDVVRRCLNGTLTGLVIDLANVTFIDSTESAAWSPAATTRTGGRSRSP